MTKTLQKVQKRISKKKGSTVSLHENSRDIQKLRRAASRSEKLERQGKQREMIRYSIMERIQWLAKRVAVLDDPVPLNLVRSHIDLYLAEKAGQIAVLAANRRPNRPKSLEQLRMEKILEGDTKEYKSGFWLPDTMSKEGWEALKKWYEAGEGDGTGDWATLDTLLYVRVTSDGNVKRSSFPPNGDS